MPSVSFIYRIGRNPKTYYGKQVCDYISDDHDGLDRVVSYDLVRCINIFKKTNKYFYTYEEEEEEEEEEQIKRDKRYQIKIGILSSATNQNYLDYSTTKAEIEAFDYYCTKYGYEMSGIKIYMNGTQLK
jgi:hypothetical protein